LGEKIISSDKENGKDDGNTFCLFRSPMIAFDSLQIPCYIAPENLANEQYVLSYD